MLLGPLSLCRRCPLSGRWGNPPVSSCTDHSALCRGQESGPRAATGPALTGSQTAGKFPRNQPAVWNPAAGGWDMEECLWESPPQDSGIVTHKAGLLPRSVDPSLQGELVKLQLSLLLPPSWRAGNYFYRLLPIKTHEMAWGRAQVSAFDVHKGSTFFASWGSGPSTGSPGRRGGAGVCTAWRTSWNRLLPDTLPLVCWLRCQRERLLRGEAA